MTRILSALFLLGATFVAAQHAQIAATNNFDTEKQRVSMLLGEHEYPAVLEAAKSLNKRVPDDVMVYGLLDRRERGAREL